MVFISTSGYVLSVLGPYLSDSKNNEAQILNHVLENIEEIHSWLHVDDVVIVDRGFRDAVDFLESKFGIKCQMAAFLPKEQNQFDTENSNCSRLVTKIRWVVESLMEELNWRYLERFCPIRNCQI